MKQIQQTVRAVPSADREPAIIRLKLDLLQPHLLQSQFVDACAPEEDEQFRESIRGGQRTPIEVLPADAEGKHTIVDGCRRVAALLKNGETYVNAIIRHDLAAAGDATIELAFLGANLHRRHLSAMQEMRVTRRMLEIELSRGRSSGASRTKVKSGLAKVMGISPRMLNRYLLATDAPVEVQRAVDAGLLTLVEAGKIALLPAQSQADLAELMHSPISRAEVKKHLRRLGVSSRSSAKHVRINDALSSFIRIANKAVDDLAGRIGELSPRFVASQLPGLQKLTDLLAELLNRADAVDNPDDCSTSDSVSQTKLKRRN